MAALISSFKEFNFRLRKKRQVIGVPGGWNLAELTGGKEQYWACRRKSVRIRMPSGPDRVANLFLYLME